MASSFIKYSIRGGSHGNTGAQSLKLRFGSYRLLVFPSPAAGMPDEIVQRDPSTLMGEALFPFPLSDIQQQQQQVHFWVMQFLSSFDLRSPDCQIIFNKIASSAHQLAAAAGDVNVSYCIEVDIHRVKVVRTEPTSDADDEDIATLGGLEEDPAPSTWRGAPEWAIEGLRNQKLDVEEITTGECCSVCCEDLKAGEKEVITKMPCAHLYHQSCIFTWLQSNNSCPLCRAPLQQQQQHY